MNIELLDYALKLNCNKHLQITNNHNNVYLHYNDSYLLEFRKPFPMSNKTFPDIEWLGDYLKMLFNDEVIDNSVNQFIIDYNVSTINNNYFTESVN